MAVVARRGFSLLHPALVPRDAVADCSTKLTRLLCLPDIESNGGVSCCPVATFLNVILHSSSSPAKTLGSLNRTKTCMSEGIIDLCPWNGRDLAQLDRTLVLSAQHAPYPQRPRSEDWR